MATFSVSLSTSAAVLAAPVVFPVLTDSFVNLEDAEQFTVAVFNTEPWTSATDVQKLAALRFASRLINQLPFDGDKADPDQFLAFPRNEETEIPTAIQEATVLCAIRILDGYDPEIEAENMHMTSQTYSGVRSSYEAGRVPENMYMGIPSFQAYKLLVPYLRDRNAINLTRAT